MVAGEKHAEGRKHLRPLTRGIASTGDVGRRTHGEEKRVVLEPTTVCTVSRAPETGSTPRHAPRRPATAGTLLTSPPSRTLCLSPLIEYRLLSKKGEGTFSEVLKAQCIKNGKYVAIKCMKNHFDSLEQVNNLREIQALRRLSPNQNIIKLLEVLYDQPTGRLALVFELMDMNVYEMIKGRRHYIAEEKVKNYMYQLIKAMDHMHSNGIFHRDVKPENILIMDDMLKGADFGSCRGIYSK